MRFITGAAVGEGCGIVGDLQRGKQVIRLADSVLYGIAGTPWHPDGLRIFRRSQCAGFFCNLDACRLSKAEFTGIFVHFLNPDLITGFKEEIVAGNLNRVNDADVVMGARTAAELQFPVSLISTAPTAVIGCVCVKNALLQACDGNTGLHGRARLISAHHGAVP